MRRTVIFLFGLYLLGNLVGCGGSPTPTPPPPNNAGYSNASLTGTFVFRLSGQSVSGDIFSAVGVFTTDGNGNITSGQQDTNDLGFGVVQQLAFTGTYTIGQDGRGQATFNYASTFSPTTFRFVLTSSSRARVIEASNVENSNGVIEQQDATAIGALNGNYVLHLDGVNANAFNVLPVSQVGLLTANPASAVIDENFNGTFTPQIATTSATVTIGAGGRGTLQFVTTTGGLNGSGGAFSYVFYIVNSTRLQLLELDQSQQLSGAADGQTGTFTTASVNGTYVYNLIGISQSGLPITEAGTFALNGSAGITGGVEDFIENGRLNTLFPFSGSYSVGNNGRVAGQFVGSGRTVNFVLWFSSPQSAAFLATAENGIFLIENGPMASQPALPTNATLNGNYSLRLSGLSPNGLLDIAGQNQANGQGGFTGLNDFNQAGNVQVGVSANGSYSFTSGRGSGSIGGIPLVFYPADANTIYMMSTDPGRLLVGALEAQH